MPEAICCCLQTCNVLESKVMVANTCILSLVVIGTTVKTVLVLYITNNTLVPEAICCCLQTSTYCFFVNVVRYICRETFVSKTCIVFELYEHMYCYYNVLPEAIFVVYL